MPKGTKHKATIEKEVARELLRDMVKEALPSMTAAQIAAAHGIKYLMARNKKGGQFKRVTEEMGKAYADGTLSQEDDIIEVWEKDPSTSAFTDLLNRTLDKPTEHLEAVVSVSGLGERIARARERVKRS
jgi:hypothetical protein